MQWRSGQLQVRALDEQISNVGGAFTVVVDSAARRGIVSVQDGLVTLRSGTVAAGQSFTFGPGQPLQPIVVRAAGLDEIHFHSHDVWKEPFSLTRTLSAIPHPPIPHPALATVRALPWKRHHYRNRGDRRGELRCGEVLAQKGSAATAAR